MRVFSLPRLTWQMPVCEGCGILRDLALANFTDQARENQNPIGHEMANPVNKNRAVVKIVTDAIRGCAEGYHVKSSSSRGMLWCQIECTLAAQLRGRRAEQLDRAGGGGRGRRIMCSGLILFRSANFCAKPGIDTRIADTVIFKIEN